MRIIILAAALLVSTVAYADDPAKPADAPATAGAPAQPDTSKTEPAKLPSPPTSVWQWTDMDATDLNTLSQCAQELPKKLADPWIAKISAHIKPVR